jgi:AcrR family transcriptional regulator
VEPLARRLGVTKGSFYWHFPSRDALLQAALERWEVVEQEEIFGTLERIPDPRDRLRALFQVVAHEVKSHIIYSELLKALDHPAVSPVIGRVSQRRLDYLTASFRQAGLGRTAAQHRARLAYAAYVGFLQLSLQLHQPRLQHEEFEAYVEHVMQTLIPAP